MKKCAYCNEPVINKQKSARFCSVLCRIKAYRERNGIVEPFSRKEGKNEPEKGTNIIGCCEHSSVYSPAFRSGEVLLCQNCHARWERV